MSPFVLDCSVSAAWCLHDETNDAAHRLLAVLGETEAMVPELWRPEMANVLAVAERRGRIDQRDAEEAVSLLGRLPMRVVASEPDTMKRLVGLARETGLSAYDASYLELALRLNLALATFDEHLAKAAAAVGVAPGV